MVHIKHSNCSFDMGDVFEEANFKKSHFELKVDVLIAEFGIAFCGVVFSKWMHSSCVEYSNMWKVAFKV